MNDEALAIPTEKKYQKVFSICTIVKNREEYRSMKESFIEKGFSSQCEYLVADNADKNNFDAYTAIRRFLQDAVGRYIIIVHQDVRCIDNIDKLLSSLDELEAKDAKWAICGNAGGNGYKNIILNLDNNGKLCKSDNMPARVTSLDENLLIIKADSHLTISGNIKSFHLYGTDMCIIADFLGYSCYIIDFMVTHLSLGNLKELEEYKPAFIAAYGHKFRERFIQTSCTKFYLGPTPAKNKLYNSKFVFFWVKAINRLSNAIKK